MPTRRSKPLNCGSSATLLCSRSSVRADYDPRVGESLYEVIAGLVLIAGAGFAFRHRRALAKEMAAWNRLQYDRRVTLLNRERAERLAEAHRTGPVDHWGVIFGCVVVTFVGAVLIVAAVA